MSPVPLSDLCDISVISEMLYLLVYSISLVHPGTHCCAVCVQWQS